MPVCALQCVVVLLGCCVVVLLCTVLCATVSWLGEGEKREMRRLSLYCRVLYLQCVVVQCSVTVVVYCCSVLRLCAFGLFCFNIGVDNH